MYKYVIINITGKMDTIDAIREAITVALKRSGGKATPVAIPLALAPSAANEIARANHFNILTAEEVISDEYRPEKIEGDGLIVYEYFPTRMKVDENELFMARLQAYRDCTNKVVLLFLLMCQEAPIPEPSILKSAWATGLFKKGELYEVTTFWRKVTLSSLKPASFLGLLPSKGWRKQQLLRWETTSWTEPF